MATQNQDFVLSGSKTYTSTKRIATKAHMSVWVTADTGLAIWTQLDTTDYDLINNSAVVGEHVELRPFTYLRLTVGDTPEETLLDHNATQLDVWEATASAMTSSSYSSQPLDEFVIVYTSNGDGTYAQLVQPTYSALHYEYYAKQSYDTIVPAGDVQVARVIAEGDTQDLRIETEGDTQEASVIAVGDTQDARVIASGDAQVLVVETEGQDQVDRVRLIGDAQEAIVENEGDTQVARLIADVDVAEDYSGWSEAYSLTSDAWANTAVNTDVIVYDWDSVNDVLVPRTLVGERSALHWQTIAQTVASGLKFQGTWDSVDCSLPATPVPPASELANGYFYVVTSVTGDTTGCPTLSEGDWIVWSGDLTGDSVVEGAWVVVDWTFDWSAITGVPENVYNALSRAGGTMTAPTLVNYDASAPAANEYVARSYIDALTALFMPINAAIPFTAVPRTAAAQGTEVSELTRKDYVDGLNATQDSAIALNTAKVGITTAQTDAIVLNTAKVSYKDTMTFDGTTLTITIG